MSGIWVVVEHNQGDLSQVTFEMLGEGRKVASRLGEELDAVFLGQGGSRHCNVLAQYGADKVFVAEHDLLANYSTDAYTLALTALVRQWDPTVLVLAASPNGRDLAPRVAARLGTALVADCLMLKVNNQRLLEMTRPAYRDRVYITVNCPESRPVMVTMRPGVVGVHRPDPSRTAEIVHYRPEMSSSAIRTRVLEFIKAEPSTIDIAEAEIVVEGGLGVGQPERWQLIERLAAAVGGSVGGSRMAMDAGWITRERLVGLTGKTIAPKLAIACGISGAMQHMAGLRDVETLVAINSDRNAPIMKQADLGVVADLHALIPAIVDELQSGGKGTEQQ